MAGIKKESSRPRGGRRLTVLKGKNRNTVGTSRAGGWGEEGGERVTDWEKGGEKKDGMGWNKTAARRDQKFILVVEKKGNN